MQILAREWQAALCFGEARSPGLWVLKCNTSEGSKLGRWAQSFNTKNSYSLLAIRLSGTLGG